ncbi:hypothetical protein Z951_44265 [Streptomyces sp. PRh5]|nr:hypothetical protein Z951_44265 [Streptomyces sp. PRh5]
MRLAEHPDVDMIALTGSVTSGRAVARAAADSLKRVHLELGGKAPVVIFPDADLAAAASPLRVAGFWAPWSRRRTSTGSRGTCEVGPGAEARRERYDHGPIWKCGPCSDDVAYAPATSLPP